ncbi:MAG TPA: hypothetical protein VIK14_02600 [Ignavibacteria bacterium]
MKNHKEYFKVPISMQGFLGKLFGELSEIANKEYKTKSEWRNTLKKILEELNLYLIENIETDEVHIKMLKRSLESSKANISEDFFWPGYLEGILRFSLILLGDLPNHYRRKKGRKSINHYNLKRFRKINYYQDVNQKINLLFNASKIEDIIINKNLFKIRKEFYNSKQVSFTNYEFIKWFKKNYPEDYSKIF